jgi:hypothetical protein
MYDRSDPRAALMNKVSSQRLYEAFRSAEYAKFYETSPQIIGPHCRTWLTRGRNAVVAYSIVEPGGRLSRTQQVDEWTLLLPDLSTSAVLTANNGGMKEAKEVVGQSITFVPPGETEIIFPNGGRVVRLFTTRSADLAALCPNANQYSDADSVVPPFRSWPTPKDGYRIRSYCLDVADEPGRFGRIWRCTTLMVNCLPPQSGPRDPTKLSPHHHDDFEQYSLALSGSFIHHLRWPWTPNMKLWRADEHEFCGTPSVAIIPPPVIHTTRALDPGINTLVDIFSPPRFDFSAMPGWVLNSDDYPVPV